MAGYHPNGGAMTRDLLLLSVLVAGCATPATPGDLVSYCRAAAKTPWPCATRQQIEEHGYRVGSRPGLPMAYIFDARGRGDCP